MNSVEFVVSWTLLNFCKKSFLITTIFVLLIIVITVILVRKELKESNKDEK